MSAQFRVLIVCTANRYRSPLAEHLMADAARRHGVAVTVRSAGVAARDDEPLDPEVERILRKRRIHPGSWASRRLTVDQIDTSDLILTATAAHRAAVVSMAPQALRRTFMLLQFARYADSIAPVTSGADLMSAVTAVRAGLQPVPAGADDVADPAGASLATLRACAEQLNDAVTAVLWPMAVESSEARQTAT